LTSLWEALADLEGESRSKIFFPTRACELSEESELSPPREPGDDDDRPTPQAWLEEFNRLIGRRQSGDER
jgi:hypothetical protein